jgi:hypothetical protein
VLSRRHGNKQHGTVCVALHFTPSGAPYQPPPMPIAYPASPYGYSSFGQPAPPWGPMSAPPTPTGYQTAPSFHFNAPPPPAATVGLPTSASYHYPYQSAQAASLGQPPYPVGSFAQQALVAPLHLHGAPGPYSAPQTLPTHPPPPPTGVPQPVAQPSAPPGVQPYAAAPPAQATGGYYPALPLAQQIYPGPAPAGGYVYTPRQ